MIQFTQSKNRHLFKELHSPLFGTNPLLQLSQCLHWTPNSHTQSFLYISGSQSVVRGPAGCTSTGNLSEMKILGTSSQTHWISITGSPGISFNQPCRSLVYTQTGEPLLNPFTNAISPVWDAPLASLSIFSVWSQPLTLLSLGSHPKLPKGQRKLCCLVEIPTHQS